MSIAQADNVNDGNLPVLCQACSARSKGICGALSAVELEELSKVSRRRMVEAGDIIYFDDDDVHQFANIVDGIVKLSKGMTDGRQQIVGLQFPPDFLGRPFCDKSHLSAEAATDVELCVFPRKVMEKMLHQAPELEHRLFAQTLVQLDEARDWMVTLGRKTAAEKVASFLYLIATHAKAPASQNQPVYFLLPLTRADIADFLGLTIETVSRQITKLRKTGSIVVENNRRVMIADMGMLRLEAGS